MHLWIWGMTVGWNYTTERERWNNYVVYWCFICCLRDFYANGCVVYRVLHSAEGLELSLLVAYHFHDDSIYRIHA